jgi:CRISPR-associated protein Cas4
MATDLFRTFLSIFELDGRVITIVFLITVAIIVIDGLLFKVQKSNSSTGLTIKNVDSQKLRIEGIKRISVDNFLSKNQGLSGKPDAVIMENGLSIPVEHKPLGTKLRDRYVAQLLIYMRLIEEKEGHKPPYGYLIMGKNARRIKVTNTPEKQFWVDSMLSEMRAILEGKEAKASPHPSKCAKCKFRNSCHFKMEK